MIFGSDNAFMDGIGTVAGTSSRLGAKRSARLELGAVSQELTLLDQVPAEGDLRGFPGGQRLFDVTGVVGEGAGQVERVANRFAGAGAVCGLGTKAASPRRQTRPNAILVTERSRMACKKG